MKEGDDRSFSGGQAFPPALGVADLEALSKTFHYEPKTWSDSIAKVAVDIMEKIMHLFFREKVRLDFAFLTFKSSFRCQLLGPGFALLCPIRPSLPNP